MYVVCIEVAFRGLSFTVVFLIIELVNLSYLGTVTKFLIVGSLFLLLWVPFFFVQEAGFLLLWVPTFLKNPRSKELDPLTNNF